MLHKQASHLSDIPHGDSAGLGTFDQSTSRRIRPDESDSPVKGCRGFTGPFPPPLCMSAATLFDLHDYTMARRHGQTHRVQPLAV